MTLLKPGQLLIKEIVAWVKASGNCLPMAKDMKVPATLAHLAPQATIAPYDSVSWTLQLCLLISVGIWLVLMVAFFLSTVVSGGRLLLFLMVLQPASVEADSGLSVPNVG